MRAILVTQEITPKLLFHVTNLGKANTLGEVKSVAVERKCSCVKVASSKKVSCGILFFWKISCFQKVVSLKKQLLKCTYVKN